MMSSKLRENILIKTEQQCSNRNCVTMLRSGQRKNFSNQDFVRTHRTGIRENAHIKTV